jgi:hypothetical protein
MQRLWVLALLCGCASEPLTEYEIQDRYNVAVFEYNICLKAAEKQGRAWVVYRRGPHHPNRPKSYMDMREEMMQNGCRVRYR